MNPNRSMQDQTGAANRLRAVAGRLEVLVQQQLEQLETLTVASDSPDDFDQQEFEEYQRRVREFEVARGEFEVERTLERERLTGEAEQLAEAWRELEHEQRELKKEQQMGRSLATESVSEPAQEEQPQETVLATAVGSTQDVTTNENPDRAKSPTSNRQGGSQQFQQLRREMLQHARQRKRR